MINRSILVTGGAGFIGANLVRLLLNEGYQVRVLDNFSVGRREYLDGLGLEVIGGDILDPETVAHAVTDVDGVVHLAAQSCLAAMHFHKTQVRSVYDRDKDTSMAEAELLRALELAPQNKWAYYHLGEIYRQEERTGEAVAMYERALEIDPTFDAAQKRLVALRDEK